MEDTRTLSILGNQYPILEADAARLVGEGVLSRCGLCGFHINPSIVVHAPDASNKAAIVAILNAVIDATVHDYGKAMVVTSLQEPRATSKPETTSRSYNAVEARWFDPITGAQGLKMETRGADVSARAVPLGGGEKAKEIPIKHGGEARPATLAERIRDVTKRVAAMTNAAKEAGKKEIDAIIEDAKQNGASPGDVVGAFLESIAAILKEKADA